MMESLFFGLIIGIISWLLGLLSSPVTSRILKSYRRNDIKLLVKSDLENLRDRLEGTCTSIDLHFGNCDIKSFERMKSTFEKSEEFFPDKPLKSKDMSYKQYEEAMSLVKKNPTSFLNVKQFSLPLVNTTLPDLSVLDLSYQKSLLWILHRLNLLNDEISFSMSQAALTFSPEAMKQCGEAIRKNIDSSYIKIKDQAEDLASYISKFISKQKLNRRGVSEMKTKYWVGLIFILIVLAIGGCYWFSYRPETIKKECHRRAEMPYFIPKGVDAEPPSYSDRYNSCLNSRGL